MTMLDRTQGNLVGMWRMIADAAEKIINARVAPATDAQTSMVDQAKTKFGCYIILTEPSRENTAAAGLVGRGFECYAPTIVKSVWTKTRQRRRVNCPMFPGYLFVHLQLGNEPWSKVRAVPGVREFLRTEGRPITVPAIAIDKIKLKEGELLLPPKERADYWKGKQVEVMKGPFATFLGPIERMSGNDRVKVMLDIFGRGVEVDLHESEIRFTEVNA